MQQGSKAYIAVIDVYNTDNTSFTTMQANSRVVWQEVTNGVNGNQPHTRYVHPALEAMRQLVPNFIPGTGTNKTDGVLKKQKKYNMRKQKSFTDINGNTVTIPLYTLGYSQHNLFEMYQAVQNDGTGNVNGDIYYAKIDQINPEDIGGELDYYKTVAVYANRENLYSTDYYYVNDVKAPPIDSNGRITFARDPVRLDRAMSSVT